MAGEEQKSAHHIKGTKSKKKLRKREQLLEERLTSARAALAGVEERQRRIGERVSKWQAKVQNLETQLIDLRHVHEEAHSAPLPPEQHTPLAQSVVVAETSQAGEVGALLVVTASEEWQTAGPLPPLDIDPVSPDTPQQDAPVDRVESSEVFPAENDETALVEGDMPRVDSADQVIQQTEEEALQAIEDVYAFMEQLETTGQSRHLTEELAHLQAQADSAKQRALVARDQVAAALSSIEDAESSTQANVSQTSSTRKDNERPEGAVVYGGQQPYHLSLLSPAEEDLVALPHEEEQDIVHMSSLLSDEEHLSELFALSGEPEERPLSDTAPYEPQSGEAVRVADIVEEEEDIEAVTALIIADAAAAAAAEAEAMAEASSARIREALAAAQQADEALEQLRQAVELDELSGEEAEVALRAAELQATRAHATLADAEAAAERARRIAMDAEAEAEVAEGMAFATDELAKGHVQQTQESAQQAQRQYEAGGSDATRSAGEYIQGASSAYLDGTGL